MSQGLLIEKIRPVVVAVPIDTTGAAVASDWVSLTHYRRCLFVIAQGAWAGGTPAVTLKQATSAAGSTTAALSFDARYPGVALTDDLYTKTTVSSDTFNLPATANTVNCIEVHAQDLTAGYTHVQLNVASPGANADLICVIAILGDPAWAGKPDVLPSTIS